jgi:hypothetical protein
VVQLPCGDLTHRCPASQTAEELPRAERDAHRVRLAVDRSDMHAALLQALECSVAPQRAVVERQPGQDAGYGENVMGNRA